MPAVLQARLSTLAKDAAAAYQQTRDVERALRPLIELIPFAALVANNEGRYVITNGPAAALTGYQPAELHQLSVWQLTPMGAHDDAVALWRAFLVQREQSGTFDIQTKDGRTLTLDYAACAHVLPRCHVSLLKRTASTVA